MQNQFNASTCSNISFNAESYSKNVEQRSSSTAKFEECNQNISDINKIPPIWRSSFNHDTGTPQYKPIKPILTPTTGRSSAYSNDQSPIPFEKPQKFTSTTEQFNKMKSESQLLKPKPVSAKFLNQTKAWIDSTQYYTATAGPPFHNQNEIISETSSEIKRKETESSQQTITSSMMKMTKLDEKYHEIHTPIEKRSRPISFSASPTQYTQRQKIPLPPTPSRFIPGEYRESDYESEVESMKIRPIWTPREFDSDNSDNNVHFRHVSAPPSKLSISMTKIIIEWKII